MVGLNLNDLKRPSDVNKKPEMEFQNNNPPIESENEENQEQIENNTPISLSQLQTPSTHQAEPEESDEGWLSFFARNATRGISRVGEQVLGGYGNIVKTGKDILTAAPKYLGPVGDAIYDLVGEKGWEKLIKGSEPEPMFKTSQELKEHSQQLTGGYTKPQSKEEEKYDQFLEDVGSTINPSGRLSIGRNLSVPAAANAAKELVEWAGLGEDAANKTKMAVWLPMMLSRSVNGPQHASNLMNQGRQGIPDTVQMSVPRFTQALNQVEYGLLNSDPRTLMARQLIANIRNDLANGQTSAQSLMTMYDGVNAAKRSRGMFELGRTDRAFATNAIDQVRHSVRNELMNSASAYPEALNSWSNGVAAWATVHRSNALTNWVESVAKGPYAKALTGPAAALFGVGSWKLSALPAQVSGPIIGSAAAVAKTGQTLYRMYNNPDLANYYFRAITAATNENLPAFLNNFNKLNKML